uniref:Protease n=1 Tax=viral metagenome TaxID=1070528 RepID=A0A6C0H056_9ZZZZ
MMKRRFSEIWAGQPPSKKSKNEQPENDDSEDEGMPDVFKLFKGASNPNCYSIDNNIYFNDDINMENVCILNKEIRNLQNKLLIQSIKMGIEPAPIKLHITTYGGSIHAAFSVIGCIKSSKVPVHTICDGYVASAGTLISVCGSKRYIHRHANMLIHELRSSMWGKMSVMEEEMTNLKKMMNKIKDIYVAHSKLKRKDLDHILKKDQDWDAEECLKSGLVDEIID